MKSHTRLIVSLIAWLTVSWCVFWCLALLPAHHPDFQWRIARIAALLCGVAAAAFTWVVSASPSRELIRCVLLGALLTGGIAFLAGFIGPIIFYPRSNQGPLLGIIFTGPIGFVAGAFGGAAYCSIRRKQKANYLPPV